MDEEKPDVGVVASFRHMIPNFIIDKFSVGMFVVHPSLLPKYRGPCPIQHAILNQDKETGVSIIEISKNEFDAGAIVHQTKLNIDEGMKFKELSQTLATLGGMGMLQVLSDIEGHRARKVI